MSSTLVQVIVALAKGAAINTPTGAASIGTSVVVTDSSGTPQPAVVLTGTESPTPWAFTTSVAPGNGTVVATDLDVNNVVLGTQSQSFTEAGTPPTFQPSTGISVTPVTVAAQVAAARTQKR